MELTIHVPDQVKVQAEAFGLAPESYAEKLVRDDLAKSTVSRSPVSVRAAVEDLRNFRKGKKLKGLTAKELVNDGRKY